ncbi:hypothetical protein CVT24_004042 [Panaeolus cyanescens]|uniref:GmrSD restriction endonucleases N-terminal domain-containing protein n=1 Tax=Panaeolus cyanescens TaxID=181874 RepID=A0A409Y6I3_9AGAR|nr:hypothetical protein CVT24_004042 [Panaeolus cyanescens]
MSASTSQEPVFFSPATTKNEVEVDELEDDVDFESDSEDPTAFRIRDALEPPLAKIQPIKELHNLIHEGFIDLNPPYQREVVWPESKQSGLIDSLFRNFYIPPVVFAVRPDAEGEMVRVCVDGKQRLTSIQKFFDGQIPFKDPVTKKSWWYTASDSTSATRNIIPDRFKKDFAEKMLPVVEYDNLTSGAERDIFQRVQLGMTLTVAEKLQAISSPWAEWISELEQKHVVVEGGLLEVIEWDTKRGRDFQNIAHMVYCCDGIENEPIPTAQKIEKWISRVDPPSSSFKKDIEDVLRGFWVLATDDRLKVALGSRVAQRIAPVEFIFIGVLLYCLKSESRKVQSQAILTLRQTVRQEFRDIRNNSTVAKAFWSHIRVLENDPTTRLIPNTEGQSSVAKGKRKRKDDNDDEYRPLPVKSLGKTAKTRSTKPSKSK